MLNQHTYGHWVFRWLGQGAIAVLGAVLLITALLPSAMARNLPGRRVAAGTRGECLIAQPGPQEPLPLLILLPATNLSLTAQAQPEFFWFNPPMIGEAVRFQLHAVDANRQNPQLLYEHQVEVGDRVGIHSLPLPTDGQVPPLVVGQLYRWSLTPLCSEEAERNLVWRVTGWIEPITPPAEPIAGTLEQQILSTAEAERWLDAFSLLREATCAVSPNPNPVVKDTWLTLLDRLDLEQTRIDLPLLKQQAIANLDTLCQ
ncbi:DUF928 domain-containing protein [Trichothermofontia sp.]